jgi:neutral ceramidase
MAKKFLAGAATSNITPPLGVSLNGGMTDRRAAHIHDELHARCLVLDDGETRIALAVCDSCMIPRELCDVAKHLAHEWTGPPPDRILVAATHTHTAPTVAGVFQSEPDEEYEEFLVKRIADGIRRAVNNLSPAKVGWAVGHEPTQVFNRRWHMNEGGIEANPFGGFDKVRMNPPRASKILKEPAGPTDPEVCLLSVVSPEGRPIALLANYSLHYVGGTGPDDVSADYFAVFADRIQQLLSADRQDPPFVGIMTNGTSGDINNIDFRRAGDRAAPYEQMRRVAHIVADAAHAAVKTIKYHDWAPLGMRETRLRLARRLPAKGDIGRAKAILAKARGEQLTVLPEIYARETVLMESWPKEIEIILQALRIGDLGIAAIPCEVFVEIGLAIKKHSPFRPTFTIELANGYAGYLPTVAQHALGGYETWRARSSFLEVEAELKIREKVLELLRMLSS